MSLRVTPDTKRALDTAAERAGRSLSQEAEALIEHALRDKRTLLDALELAYGRQLAGLLMALGLVMKDAGAHSAVAAGSPFASVADWMENPVAYRQAEIAAQQVLDAVRPTVAPDTVGATKPDACAEYGREIAAGALEALSNSSRGGWIGEWAAAVRPLLGPAAARIEGDFQTIAVSAIAPNPAGTTAALARMSNKRPAATAAKGKPGGDSQ